MNHYYSGADQHPESEVANVLRARPSGSLSRALPGGGRIIIHRSMGAGGERFHAQIEPPPKGGSIVMLNAPTAEELLKKIAASLSTAES